MHSSFTSFTIYDLLRIILPGLYLTTGFYRISDYIQEFKINTFSETEFTFWYFLLSIIAGIFIYSFDFPKSFSIVIHELPTNVIRRRHPEIDRIRIFNNYFQFYDSVEGDFKPKMENISGYFHLAFNLSVVSIFLLFLNCCIFRTQWINLSFIIIVLFFSLSSAILIYELRLKNFYRRSLEAYFISNFYNKLNPTNVNPKK